MIQKKGGMTCEGCLVANPYIFQILQDMIFHVEIKFLISNDLLESASYDSWSQGIKERLNVLNFISSNN